MLNCPRCGSPNIVSNKPIAQAHIEQVADAARLIQRYGHRRCGAATGIGALLMQGANTFWRDCRCTSCGTKFDLDDDPVSSA